MTTDDEHRSASGALRGSQRPLVIGVDGCRGGWVAIILDREHRKLEPVFVPTLSELVEAYPVSWIGVDMPVGLSSTGTRQCDVDARKFLGPGRTSSVFPPPIPQVLGARTYEEASSLSKRHHPQHKSLSRQTFAILPGLREVRAVITPALQQRIVEVHPEVSFAALAGRPLRFGKRTPEGFDERRDLLQAAFDIDIPDRRLMRSFFSRAAPDDVLDAMVAAWSAQRFAEGRAGRFPAVEERDELGLRMEMVF
jgi:predicted RNase H-like nuclease